MHFFVSFSSTRFFLFACLEKQENHGRKFLGQVRYQKKKEMFVVLETLFVFN